MSEENWFDKQWRTGGWRFRWTYRYEILKMHVEEPFWLAWMWITDGVVNEYVEQPDGSPGYRLVHMRSRRSAER